MNISIVKQQKSSDQTWLDEKGISVPYNRTTKVERLMEHKSYTLLKRANDMHEKLKSFKKDLRDICDNVYQQFLAENKIEKKNAKGNFTWYNFDRSIKIEVSVNQRIEFDEMTISACKDKLDKFLAINVESKDEFIKQMVTDAFENSKGRLDSKKVMSLLRYKSKIKVPLFLEAMELLEKSIRRPDSKVYFRVWFKEEDASYKNVDLNFSSI